MCEPWSVNSMPMIVNRINRRPPAVRPIFSATLYFPSLPFFAFED